MNSINSSGASCNKKMLTQELFLFLILMRSLPSAASDISSFTQVIETHTTSTESTPFLNSYSLLMLILLVYTRSLMSSLRMSFFDVSIPLFRTASKISEITFSLFILNLPRKLRRLLASPKESAVAFVILLLILFP